MPRSIGKYQCKTCNEIFTATSDRYTSCPCGASKIKPHETHYSGYSYEENTVTVIDGRSYYLSEEFAKPSDKALELIQEIERRCHERLRGVEDHVYYYAVRYHQPDENGNRSLLDNFEVHIEANQKECSVACNKLRIYVSFKQKSYQPFDMQEAENRLEQFLETLKNIQNNSLKLSHTKNLQTLSEENDLYLDKTQVDEYNYTLLF